MKVIYDLSHISAWTGRHGVAGRITEVPLGSLGFGIPEGFTATDAAIRFNQRDGERASFDPDNRERCELTTGKRATGAIVEGKVYRRRFHKAFAANWPRSGSDWLITGQLHLIGGRQPICTFYAADGVLQLKTSKGGGHTTRWGTALVPERWYALELTYCASKSTKDGFVALSCDGVEVLPRTPVAMLPDDVAYETWEGVKAAASWKDGVYRSAEYAGTADVYLLGCQHGVPDATAPPAPIDPLAALREQLAIVTAERESARALAVQLDQRITAARAALTPEEV